MAHRKGVNGPLGALEERAMESFEFDPLRTGRLGLSSAYGSALAEGGLDVEFS
jgi:hypothetical protein